MTERNQARQAVRVLEDVSTRNLPSGTANADRLDALADELDGGVSTERANEITTVYFDIAPPTEEVAESILDSIRALTS
jgi:hypothetical protein